MRALASVFAITCGAACTTPTALESAASEPRPAGLAGPETPPPPQAPARPTSALIAPSAPGSSPLAAQARVRATIDPALGVAFGRPTTARDGSLTPLPTWLPVIVRFDHAPGDAELAALAGLGLRIHQDPYGAPRVRGQRVLASVTRAQLAPLARVPGLVRVTLDRPLVPAPAPADDAMVEVQATDAWRQTLGDTGVPLGGQGVTICDIDSGVNPFHPAFFRADGGYYAWKDQDGDGQLTPGVDTVAIDGYDAVLRVLESSIYADVGPLVWHSDAFDVGIDYLYADMNESGAREFGRAGGYDDSAPALGEPLFLVDDVDGDGLTGAAERLVRLATPKFRMVQDDDGKQYVRGQNLADAPLPDNYHGTTVDSILVGGTPGLTRYVGVAPDADVVGISDNKLLGVEDEPGSAELFERCRDAEADVILQEYAHFTGYHLDGGSEYEALVDEAVADGIVFVSATGNLGLGHKLYENELATSGTLEVPIVIRAGETALSALFVTVLWREPARDLEFTLKTPAGDEVSFAVDPVNGAKVGPYSMWEFRDDSGRGTAMMTLSLGLGPALAKGTWTLTVTDPTPPPSGEPPAPLPLYIYVQDNWTLWGTRELGAHFEEHVSTEHLVCWPSTADSAIGVAAYNQYAWLPFVGKPFDLATYSSGGPRIDGRRIVSVTAPADPTTATWFKDEPNAYMQFGGTSGSAPFVAGAAALALALDPSATPDAIKAMIEGGARADEFTGAVPNDHWGAGKLRIYQSLFDAAPEAGEAPVVTAFAATVVRATPTELAVVVSDADDALSALHVVADLDYDGQYETPGSVGDEGARVTVTFDALGEHVIKLRVTDPSGRSGVALATMTVVEAEVLPDAEPEVGPEVGPEAATEVGAETATQAGAETARAEAAGATRDGCAGGAADVGLSLVGLGVWAAWRRARARRR